MIIGGARPLVGDPLEASLFIRQSSTIAAIRGVSSVGCATDCGLALDFPMHIRGSLDRAKDVPKRSTNFTKSERLYEHWNKKLWSKSRILPGRETYPRGNRSCRRIVSSGHDTIPGQQDVVPGVQGLPLAVGAF